METLLKVHVKSLSSTCCLSLPPHSTAADILHACKATLSQSLLFQGKALRAEQSLQSAGVEEGSTLLLVSAATRGMSGCLVRVRWYTKVLPVFCDEQMTVGNLKGICERRVGIRPGCTRLLYNGIELQDSSTIAESTAEKRLDFTLEALLKTPTAGSFGVTVKTLTGKCFPITISAAMNVANLKELINDREGIPVDSLRMVCAGHELCDHETVEQLLLTSNSVIHLVPLK